MQEEEITDEESAGSSEEDSEEEEHGVKYRKYNEETEDRIYQGFQKRLTNTRERDLTKMVWRENEKCWFCNICKKKKHSQAARRKHSKQNCANLEFQNPSWLRGWDRETMSCRYCGLTGFRRRRTIRNHIQGKACPMLPDWNQVFGKTLDCDQAGNQSWRARKQDDRKKTAIRLLKEQAAKSSKGPATSTPPKSHRKITATVTADCGQAGKQSGTAQKQEESKKTTVGLLQEQAAKSSKGPATTTPPKVQQVTAPVTAVGRAGFLVPIPERSGLGPVPERADLLDPGKASFSDSLPLMACLPNLVSGPQSAQRWAGGPQFPSLDTHLPQFSEPASLQYQHSIPLNAPMPQRMPVRPANNPRLQMPGMQTDTSILQLPGTEQDSQGTGRPDLYVYSGKRGNVYDAQQHAAFRKGEERGNVYDAQQHAAFRKGEERGNVYEAQQHAAFRKGEERGNVYDTKQHAAFRKGGDGETDCYDPFQERYTRRLDPIQSERGNIRDDLCPERNTRRWDLNLGDRGNYNNPYTERDTRPDPYRAERGNDRYNPYRERETRPDPYRAERGYVRDNPYRERDTRPDPYRAERGNGRDNPYTEREIRPDLYRAERGHGHDHMHNVVTDIGRGSAGRDDDMRRHDSYREDQHRDDSDKRRCSPYRDHFRDHGLRDRSPVRHRETLDWHRSGSRNR